MRHLRSECIAPRLQLSATAQYMERQFVVQYCSYYDLHPTKVHLQRSQRSCGKSYAQSSLRRDSGALSSFQCTARRSATTDCSPSGFPLRSITKWMGEVCTVWRVLDCRQNPAKSKRLWVEGTDSGPSACQVTGCTRAPRFTSCAVPSVRFGKEGGLRHARSCRGSQSLPAKWVPPISAGLLEWRVPAESQRELR